LLLCFADMGHHTLEIVKFIMNSAGCNDREQY